MPESVPTFLSTKQVLQETSVVNWGVWQHSRRDNDSVQILKLWDELRKLSCLGLGSGGKKSSDQQRNRGNGPISWVKMDSGGVEPRLWHFPGLGPSSITFSSYDLGIISFIF